jgi:hypothetical protein
MLKRDDLRQLQRFEARVAALRPTERERLAREAAKEAASRVRSRLPPSATEPKRR